MLEAQSNAPLNSQKDNSSETAGLGKVKKKDFNEFKVPFIYFFQSAVKFGLFKKLGDIEKLKNKCSTYSSYIDRWLANSIKNKEIKILKDGEVEPVKTTTADFYTTEKTRESCQLLENLSNKITEVGLKDLSSGAPKGLSSCNFYSLKNQPELLIEYQVAIERFLKDMSAIVEKSAQSENTDGILHYVGISTCTVDEEVLSDI